VAAIEPSMDAAHTEAPAQGITLASSLERLREAVGTVAATDPDPADPYRGLYIGDELAVRLGAGGPTAGSDARFERVCERLALDGVARAVLALCAAPEVHGDAGRMFGYLHDDLSRCAASPRLVARLHARSGLGEAVVMACFDERSVLRRSGALRLGTHGALADRPVTLATRLAAELLGGELHDVTCGGRLRRVQPDSLPVGRAPVIGRLRRLIAGAGELTLAVSGPDALEVLMAASGRGAVVLDAVAAAEPECCDELAFAAAFEDRVAVVAGIAAVAPDDRAVALRGILRLPCRPVLVVAGRADELTLSEHPVLVVRVPRASARERAEAWRVASGCADVDAVADRFRLSLRQIQEGSAIARAEAATEGGRELDADLLMRGARTASSRRVSELATLLSGGPGWGDLVLPPRQLAALHSVSSYLRHRERVLDDWGYGSIAPGQGLTALFAGASGTGKTLAARVIAGAAGLDVYRVDLAGMYSKWIGETEKNLDRIFAAAEESNAVLFFDEADVAFGKRSAVNDAGDRYANLETAYLLQRIEDYEGIIVLATNLRSNIDDAFSRRLDLVVEFPSPDVATRRRLWSALLPAQAPIDDAVDLDFLSERFELTGGAIRNCSVCAAFLAADEGVPVGMVQLVRAVALEYAKLGRLTLEADFDRFHELVRGP
jgi:hypothetical protein